MAAKKKKSAKLKDRRGKIRSQGRLVSIPIIRADAATAQSTVVRKCTIGRPSIYSIELSERVLQRMRDGESLAQACKHDDTPAMSTFMRWVSQDSELRDRYINARADLLRHWEQDIIELADTPQLGEKTKSGPYGTEVWTADMLEHRKLQIESRKWLLEKLHPNRYGSKVDVSLGGRNAPAVPVAVVAMTAEQAERAYLQLISNSSVDDEPDAERDDEDS